MSTTHKSPPRQQLFSTGTPDPEELGHRLRQHRKGKHLTLKQLGELSGVALSTLSKMELGQITVSYDKLAAVARALGVDISGLMTQKSLDENSSVTHRTFAMTDLNTAPRYGTAQYRYALLGADFTGRTMTPLLSRVIARSPADFPGFIRHKGQEFVMALENSVQILFETGEHLDLPEGGSGYFNSEVGHMYLSTGEGDAIALIVMHEGEQALKEKQQ